MNALIKKKRLRHNLVLIYPRVKQEYLEVREEELKWWNVMENRESRKRGGGMLSDIQVESGTVIYKRKVELEKYAEAAWSERKESTRKNMRAQDGGTKGRVNQEYAPDLVGKPHNLRL